MEHTDPHGRPGDAGAGSTPPSARSLRRIIVTAGLVVVGLVLILAGIYAGVFLILAPMMQ